MKHTLSAAIVCLSLAGCGSAETFDASSIETVQASIERMTADMTEAERDKFGTAVSKLVMQEDPAAVMQAAFSGQQPPPELYSVIDGMTAAEILEAAE